MKCPNKTTQERMVYSRSCQNAQMSNISAPELHQGSNQLPGHSFSSCLLLHWGRNSSSVSYLRCHWHWPRTSTFGLSSALLVSWCDCSPHLKQCFLLVFVNLQLLWAGHCPYLPSFTSWVVGSRFWYQASGDTKGKEISCAWNLTWPSQQNLVSSCFKI